MQWDMEEVTISIVVTNYNSFLIFTNITFEYKLIVNALIINGFVLDSKTIDFN